MADTREIYEVVSAEDKEREINSNYIGTFKPVQLKRSNDNKIFENEAGILLEKRTKESSYEITLKDELIRHNYALCFVNIFKALGQGGYNLIINPSSEEFPLQFFFYNIWQPKFPSGGDITKDCCYLEINKSWAMCMAIPRYSLFGFKNNTSGTTPSDEDEGYIKDVQLVLDRTEDAEILNKLAFTEANDWTSTNYSNLVTNVLRDYNIRLQSIYSYNPDQQYPTYLAKITLDRNLKINENNQEVEVVSEGAGYNMPAFKLREFVNSYFNVIMTKKFFDIANGGILGKFEDFTYKIPIKFTFQNKLIWILTDSSFTQESDYIYETQVKWSRIVAIKEYYKNIQIYLNNVYKNEAYGKAAVEHMDKIVEYLFSLKGKVDSRYTTLGTKIKGLADEYYANAGSPTETTNSVKKAYDKFEEVYGKGESPAETSYLGLIKKFNESYKKEKTNSNSFYNNIKNNYDSLKEYKDDVDKQSKNFQEGVQSKEELSNLATYVNNAQSDSTNSNTKKANISSSITSADEEYNKAIGYYKDLIFKALDNIKNACKELGNAVNEEAKKEKLDDIKDNSKFLNKDYYREGFCIVNSEGKIQESELYGLTKYYKIPSDVSFLCWDIENSDFFGTYLRFSQQDKDDLEDNDTYVLRNLFIQSTKGKINLDSFKTRLPYFAFDIGNEHKDDFFNNEKTKLWFEKATDVDMTEMTFELKNLESVDYSVEEYDNQLENVILDFEAPEWQELEQLPYNWSQGFQVWCPNLNLLSYNLLPIGYNANFVDKNLGEGEDKDFGLFKYIELRAEFNNKQEANGALFTFAFQFVNGAESDEENFGIRIRMVD